MDFAPDHNFFDFSFLPAVLNDIINDNAQDMVDIPRREHQEKFQPTLDIITRMEKRYSTDADYAYVIYALDEPFDVECNLFNDNSFIFSFPIEVSMDEIDEALMMNEDYDFEEETEDEDELIEMEENDIGEDWIDLDIEMD